MIYSKIYSEKQKNAEEWVRKIVYDISAHITQAIEKDPYGDEYVGVEKYYTLTREQLYYISSLQSELKSVYSDCFVRLKLEEKHMFLLSCVKWYSLTIRVKWIFPDSPYKQV